MSRNKKKLSKLSLSDIDKKPTVTKEKPKTVVKPKESTPVKEQKNLSNITGDEAKKFIKTTWPSEGGKFKKNVFLVKLLQHFRRKGAIILESDLKKCAFVNGKNQWTLNLEA